MAPHRRHRPEDLADADGLATAGLAIELNGVGLPRGGDGALDGLNAAVDGQLEQFVGVTAGCVHARARFH